MVVQKLYKITNVKAKIGNVKRKISYCTFVKITNTQKQKTSTTTAVD